MTEKDWNMILAQASISAMQGTQDAGITPEVLAKMSVKIAKALVTELKKEINSQNQ